MSPVEAGSRKDVPPSGGPLVLNANDSDASRYLVTRMLERGGFTVIEAATGAGALARVRERLPRLVVLDIKLPDMTGLEVCQLIKADPRTAGVKVLHTSAVFVATEFKVQSLESGADGYLSHPFEPEELIATVRSLIRLTEVEQTLRDQADALKAVNRRTNEFLAMLAHELRNPLAAIVTSLPLLERKAAADPIEQTARELIRRQTWHLRRLVDDLLDAARVTQGKIDLRWESVDFNELIRRIAANVQQTKLPARNQTLRLAMPGAQMTVRGDPMRLEQVLMNLLDNASKYSNSGAVIELGVAIGLDDEGDEEVRVTVRDRGLGMDPQTLPTIFDLFSQADVPLARSRGGLGIGLTLVKTLVELHGGSVHARSEGLGKGSEFEVRLPLRSLEVRAPTSVDSLLPPEDPTPRPRRVLIVEDNPDAQEALRVLLELWGHEVSVAPDGAAGIQAAVEQRPDVALVDLGLPMVDGYEVARRLRAELGCAAPLLIALTGYGSAEQRAQALAAGFDLHIVKPVDPDQLAALLDEYAAKPPTSARQPALREPLKLP